MRISIVVLALLLSRAASAGPSTWPELVCRGQIGVVTVVEVGDTRATLRLEGSAGGLHRPCREEQRFDPEGCYITPALITAPKGTLAKGERFLAELEPPAGAQCATSAIASHLVPLAWLGIVGALF
jgi:hypothetical protein